MIYWFKSRRETRQTLSTWTGISSEDECSWSLYTESEMRKTENIQYLVSCNVAAFSGTHSLRTLPGDWTRHGLHCGPIGIWSSSFPPKAMPPPAGPPVNLLWSTEQLLLALGRSVVFCVSAADELLLLSDEHPVSNSVSASHWDTLF